MTKKVIVGMSGGVDSSVAAYLLQKDGYEVEGLFMQNWDPALNRDLADPYIDKEICQAEEDYQDAKKVCDKLNIKLHRVNFVKEYWDNVFEYFLTEYRQGRTPNPDIFCNKYIKFQAFLDYALLNFKADYIAMGHYAQVLHEEGKAKLIRGEDLNKDQTYFLSQLNQEQLKKSLFPIGHLQKSEVRKIAQELDLVTANKKDSTGICFIGERNFGLFLSSYLNDIKGKVIDYKTKKEITEHKGLFYYTIGQRKGLNIGGSKEFGQEPWFVVGKNLTKNELYVSQDEQYLISNKIEIENINFLGEEIEQIKTIKLRYRSQDIEITDVQKKKEKIIIEYKNTTAVTPGQAAVFYNKKECLGGGIINQVYRNNEILELN